MLGSSVLGIVIPFLFVLTPVVFFHELGHFLVARWCGVKILVFSIGFGPELFGFNDRHGTRWKIAAIPLGGYVKFFGDENAASAPDLAAIACMTQEQRVAAFLNPDPPIWCIEMEKWPYQTQEWKSWLRNKRANTALP